MDPDPGGHKNVDPVDPDSDPQHCCQGVQAIKDDFFVSFFTSLSQGLGWVLLM
jgi:hypothetical protein